MIDNCTVVAYYLYILIFHFVIYHVYMVSFCLIIRSNENQKECITKFLLLSGCHYCRHRHRVPSRYREPSAPTYFHLKIANRMIVVTATFIWSRHIAIKLEDFLRAIGFTLPLPSLPRSSFDQSQHMVFRREGIMHITILSLLWITRHVQFVTSIKSTRDTWS